MYELIKKDGRAKRGRLTTVHGVIETPVFMNVGTVAAIKGAVSTDDLKDIGTQVELSNTYHLHVRTGDKLIKEFGGLHKFMHWDRPILTDSGGFQVFSRILYISSCVSPTASPPNAYPSRSILEISLACSIRISSNVPP